MKYGIIGVGEATASAIHEALADICKADKKAHFLIHARRNPQGSIPDVYDFLVDNECKFTVYTKVDDNAPKMLVSSAVEAHKTDSPLNDILKNSEEILLLWDEKDEDASKRLAVMSAVEGMAIRDLTMALTPIVVDSAEPKDTTPKVEDEDISPASPFSRDELLNMNIGVLRRQAKALGLEMGRAGKEEIVDAILGVSDAPEVASDVHVTSSNVVSFPEKRAADDDADMTEEEWASTMGNGVLMWTHTDEGNGDIATRHLTPEEVLKILEMLGPIKY